MKMFHIVGDSRFHLDRAIGTAALPLCAIPPHPLYFVCCPCTGLSFFLIWKGVMAWESKGEPDAPQYLWLCPEQSQRRECNFRVVHQRGQSLYMAVSPHRHYSTVSQALLPSLFKESALISWFNGMVLTKVS